MIVSLTQPHKSSLLKKIIEIDWLTMIMSPQIMRLVCLVKEATKSTRAGRWFGGPVRTRHCGLKESCCINQNYRNWLSLSTTEWDKLDKILVEGVNCKMWPEFKGSSEKYFVWWREYWCAIYQIFGHSPEILDMILDTRQSDGVWQGHVVCPRLDWWAPVYFCGRQDTPKWGNYEITQTGRKITQFCFNLIFNPGHVTSFVLDLPGLL